MISLSVVNTPALVMLAIVVAPYLKTKTPATSETLKLAVCSKGVLAAVPVVFWFNVGNVQLAKLPDCGVPRIGVVNDGEVAKATTVPEPVVLYEVAQAEPVEFAIPAPG